MRLLILNVDRDDDLGRKTGIRGPVIGRDEVLHAASSLALNDPEEADANGMFAAVKEYDDILRQKEAYGASDVFVAAVTGHVREGTFADNAIANQIEAILKATDADSVILVSDGGEDEHVVPVLAGRVKINGTKRVIIKQSKNLEGWLYLFSRLMDDEKLQKRFFLPLALLLVAAGASVLFREPEIFIASALFLAAFYIFVQVFRWQEPISDFLHRLGDDLKAGKLSFFASVIAFFVVIAGGILTLTEANRRDFQTRPDYAIFFGLTIYWWAIGAVLIVIVGRGMDRYIREQVVYARYWEAFFFVGALATLGYAFLNLLDAYWKAERIDASLINLDFLTYVFFGGFLFFSGLIAHQYFARVAATSSARGTGK